MTVKIIGLSSESHQGRPQTNTYGSLALGLLTLSSGGSHTHQQQTSTALQWPMIFDTSPPRSSTRSTNGPSPLLAALLQSLAIILRLCHAGTRSSLRAVMSSVGGRNSLRKSVATLCKGEYWRSTSKDCGRTHLQVQRFRVHRWDSL
jgi:hypothetical protein